MRVLVAGIGNIFLGDDAFGVEVARRLAGRTGAADGVEVADFGIRGLHLAYELIERRADLTILVDAVSRGGEPGTLYVIEPDLDAPEGGAGETVADAHAMTPDAVLAYCRRLGGRPGRVLLVGCEPASLDETMGLSEAVASAVDRAADLVLELARRPLVS